MDTKENKIEIENNSAELKGLVFDVQGHSVHDGPGTRTTVFMNGCPLDCVWCCNPEGLFHHPTIMFRDSKCVKCGRCVKACPHGAITISPEGNLKHDRTICDKCTTLECADACLKEAIEKTGKYYSIDDLMKVFKRDRQFWGSKGGVTFSGGEPLLQKDFMLAIIKECKKAYIHVAVETTSCIATDYFMKVMSYVDWMFTDIKHMNPLRHKELTGVDNRLILQNIKKIATKPDWEGFIVPRIPIIPNVNDSEWNIRETAKFVKSIDLEVINILPFHRLGESKYRQIGRIYEFENQVLPTKEIMNNAKAIIEEEGLICFTGYETPF